MSAEISDKDTGGIFVEIPNFCWIPEGFSEGVFRESTRGTPGGVLRRIY